MTATPSPTRVPPVRIPRQPPLSVIAFSPPAVAIMAIAPDRMVSPGSYSTLNGVR